MSIAGSQEDFKAVHINVVCPRCNKKLFMTPSSASARMQIALICPKCNQGLRFRFANSEMTVALD